MHTYLMKLKSKSTQKCMQQKLEAIVLLVFFCFLLPNVPFNVVGRQWRGRRRLTLEMSPRHLRGLVRRLLGFRNHKNCADR